VGFFASKNVIMRGFHPIPSALPRQAAESGVVDQKSPGKAHSVSSAMNDTISARESITSISRSLAGLEAVYDKIAAAQAECLSTIAGYGRPLRCPEGCGSCCESFIPDILPIEADYLADWLLRTDPARAERVAAWSRISALPPCPFHEADREGGHCSVYPARPLICRLFGFSSIRDKQGREAFSLCKEMPARNGGRSWSGAEVRKEFGTQLPVMSDFTAEVLALAPGDSSRRAALTEALPAALRRLALRVRLMKLESGDDPNGGEPEPSAPAPRAA